MELGEEPLAYLEELLHPEGRLADPHVRFPPEPARLPLRTSDDVECSQAGASLEVATALTLVRKRGLEVRSLARELDAKRVAIRPHEVERTGERRQLPVLVRERGFHVFAAVAEQGAPERDERQ